MNAAIGDMVHIHGRTVGAQDRTGRITEVLGQGGSPPYRVRFDDGHEALIFPGPDCVVQHLATQTGPGAR
ncbi:DUF1918 domain-containing protein [Streptomyces sp. NPDC092296]|uniref:DUF1918 domain-containing protein n=1 Tax=Streptomyces sp. NPDC092296 TaxID=3366012 RepID=UPI003800E385